MRQLLDVLREVRRRLLIHRRGLAALCAAAAVLIGLHAVRMPEADTISIWTADRAVEAGDRLTFADLRRVSLPPAAVPATAVRDPSALLGRTLVQPLEEGQPLSRSQLLGRRGVSGYPGRVALAIRMPDPGLAALLQHGDRVDLWLTDPRTPGPAALVAGGAVVLAPATRTDDGLVDDSGTGALVVFAVPPADVPKVAAATSSGFLTVSWNR